MLQHTHQHKEKKKVAGKVGENFLSFFARKVEHKNESTKSARRQGERKRERAREGPRRQSETVKRVGKTEKDIKFTRACQKVRHCHPQPPPSGLQGCGANGNRNDHQHGSGPK